MDREPVQAMKERGDMIKFGAMEGEDLCAVISLT